MKNSNNKTSGTKGEDAAAHYLEKKGYEIVKRNYRTSGAEIDLIAKKGDTLCFVEVKTRKSGDFGLPEEFVDFRKRRQIIRATRVFIVDRGPSRYGIFLVRLDLFSIIKTHIRYPCTYLVFRCQGKVEASDPDHVTTLLVVGIQVEQVVSNVFK